MNNHSKYLGGFTGSRLDQKLTISIVWGLHWQPLFRRLRIQSLAKSALAADFSKSLQFQISGGCAGGRFDQEFKISILWGGCASPRLDPDFGL